MADQIVITEKTSQAKDVRAAVGSRYGDILPAEGHLLDLLEPEDVVPEWKRWSPNLLRPEGLYGTRPAEAQSHSRGAAHRQAGLARYRLRPRRPAYRPGNSRALQVPRPGHAGAVHRAGFEDQARFQLQQLTAANARRPAIVFTHKPPASSNLECLQAAVDNGLHINLSADNLAEADELSTSGLSVVTVLPSEYGRRHGENLPAYRTRTQRLPRHSPGGLRIAVCPATYTDVSCAECQVCSRPRPNGTVIGFPAHGTRSRAVDELFSL
jgi:hypothetical protein